MTLADLLAAPTEYSVGGLVLKLREPTLLECAQYQRWLEQEARAGAARATELPEDDRRRLLADVQADIAAKRYAWGGEVCTRSLGTRDGVARLLSIINGVDYDTALAAVGDRHDEIARVMFGVLEETDQGKVLAAALKTSGLPPTCWPALLSGWQTLLTGGLSPNSPA